jgi:hypothetical protein
MTPKPTMPPPPGMHWTYRTRGCTEPGGGIVPVYSWGLDPVSTGNAPSAVADLVDARIDGAIAELQAKSCAQIEAATAVTWAARAAASYVLYAQTKSIARLTAAAHYHDEAVEHAALAGGTLVSDVRDYLAACAAKAGAT